MAAGGLVISGADYAKIIGYYFSGEFLEQSWMDEIERAQTLDATILDMTMLGMKPNAQYRCIPHCSNT